MERTSPCRAISKLLIQTSHLLPMVTVNHTRSHLARTRTETQEARQPPVATGHMAVIAMNLDLDLDLVKEDKGMVTELEVSLLLMSVS